MPNSMTGFGRGSATTEGGREVTVEVRSVNHRYCDVRVVAPSELTAKTAEVERAVRARFSRGRFDVQVSLSTAGGHGPRPTIDVGAARRYLEAMRDLARALELDPRVTLEQVAGSPGVIGLAPDDGDAAILEPAVDEALGVALEGLDEMRGTEGASLAMALEGHLERAMELRAAIAERSPLVVEERKRRLRHRTRELLEGGQLNEERLAQEVALMADRMDISEELERLGAHIEHARPLLAIEEASGRKLDFLIQEMNREANTVAAKSADGAIAHVVVDLKAELERMREQAQNLE